jgi:hypothetical protein
MGPIPPGVVKDLIGTVVIASTGGPFTSAGICVVRLEQDGDTDDGKYWDADDDTWQAAPVTWPVSAHGEVGQHLYQLPAVATAGRVGARIAVTFTDTLTEGSMTTLAGTREYLVSTVVEEVSDIAATVGAGGSLNQIADSVTVTTGTPTGSVGDTAAQDNTYHQVAISGGVIDVYYEFALPGYGFPQSVLHNGRLDRSGSSGPGLDMYAWNWDGAAWDTIGVDVIQSVNNSDSADDATHVRSLLVDHVGTGADLGKVRIRFEQSGFTSSEELFTDQILLNYAVVSRSVGYSQGAIWLDTVDGFAGTEPFVNGTADNPVDTLADAISLSAAPPAGVGLKRFRMGPNSSIVLTGTTPPLIFIGSHWDLDLNGETIDASTFIGADVIGTGVALSTRPHFEHCEIHAATLPPCHVDRCSFTDTVTLGAAGMYHGDQCSSDVAGVGAPTLDFGGVGVKSVSMRHHSGGWTIENMKAGDDLSLEGFGQFVIAASCTGGTIAHRGHWRITDNAGGVVTLIDDSLGDGLALILERLALGPVGAQFVADGVSDPRTITLDSGAVIEIAVVAGVATYTRTA